MQKIFGWVEQGNTKVSVSGLLSVTLTQKSFPLSTVTVYISGTVTPALIFSDDTGTALGNPFTANADGSWGFFVQNGVYDVVFSGTGIAAPFTLSSISAFDESVIFINVKSAPYSAQGNGIADDYNSIVSAYNALPEGGTLFFPSQSTYNISQPWVLNRSNVRILAQDPTAVIQYVGGATTSIISDNGTTTNLYFNNEISNLTIRGSINVQNGLQIVSQHHSKFLNIRIQNVVSTGMLVGFAVGNQYDVRVSNNDCPGGVYLVQPACGIDFAGLDTNHAVTASPFCYLIAEGVSGSGIRLGFTRWLVLGGFSESNNRGLEVYQLTENLVVMAMDFESNTIEDVLLNNCYYSEFITCSSTNSFNNNLGRGVNLIGGVYNNIVISPNARNMMLTGQLVYIGTITNNNAEETVISPIIRFQSGPNTFTPENRFYGDSVDVLNKQTGQQTLLRVRASAAQGGADLAQFTSLDTSTVFSRVGFNGFVQVGQNGVSRAIVQPGDATHMGSIEFYLGNTIYGTLGGGVAGSVPLTLTNGAKWAISGTGQFSRTLFSLDNSWTPGLIVNNSAAFHTFTVANAALGDTPMASLDVDLQGLMLWTYVSGANAVVIVLYNLTGGNVTLGNVNARIDVWQH